MTNERPSPRLIYTRPQAWIADATLDDTRAFVERQYRGAWDVAAVVCAPAAEPRPESADDAAP